MNTRSGLLFITLLLLSACTSHRSSSFIQTVNGPVQAESTGVFLTHEHLLVDFIGAGRYSPDRWDRDSVVRTVLHYLYEAKALGCNTFVECTPAYLGRDPVLLKRLSDETGLNILTNTGWYGAVHHKYLPPEAFTLSYEEIARMWISEWENGIESTGIRPGFIKISMDFDSITEVQKKLIRAAALTHLETGLPIAAHTGPAERAGGALDILEKAGVSPVAYIWVHAQAAEDMKAVIRIAGRGCWISLDGLNKMQITRYANILDTLKHSGLLNQILLSHDAGWYSPEEPEGGKFIPYSVLFEDFIPLLKNRGYTDEEIHQLIVINPARAFAVKVRKLQTSSNAEPRFGI